jgi:hypothetical protein
MARRQGSKLELVIAEVDSGRKTGLASEVVVPQGLRSLSMLMFTA